MNQPQNPCMKSQYVDMMPKANNMGLKTLCISAMIDMIALMDELGRGRYLVGFSVSTIKNIA